MDITPFDIYLIMQADGAKTTAAIVVFVFSVVVVAAIIMMAVFIDEEEFVAARSVLKFAGIVWVVSLALATTLPSTKTLIAMYGIPATIEMAEGLELDETAKKAVKGINAMLDKLAEGE